MKYDESRWLKKGNWKAIKEIEARQRMLNKALVPVYSTQETASRKKDRDKNKGTVPASSAIRTRNAFDNPMTGRTAFHSTKSGVQSFQSVKLRVCSKRK